MAVPPRTFGLQVLPSSTTPLLINSVVDNGDGTYTIDLSQPATVNAPDFPQIIFLELHNPADGWSAASIISGNGTAEWIIQDAFSDASDDQWRLNSTNGTITPAPLIPQSGGIA